MAETITLGKVSVSPKGAYSSTTSYTFLDTVSHNGGSFLCLQNATGIEPGVSNSWQTYWMVIGQGIKTVELSSPQAGKVTITATLSNGIQTSLTFDTSSIAAGSIGTTELANGAVTNVKIANGAVTRAKLAQDALYSPFKEIGSGDYYSTVADLGLKLKGNWENDYSVILTQANSQNFPRSAEIIVVRWGATNSVLLKTDGTRFVVNGENAILTNATLRIVDSFGVVGLQKANDGGSSGDAWLVTGNVEVSS